MPLFFIDLETTGLDPRHDAVLEVAAVVVPDSLELTDASPRFSATVYFDRKCDPSIDPIVIEMHTKNGLWMACLDSGDTIFEVDRALHAFILANGAKDAQLAGNSVHFDRAFMSVHLPRSLAELHHRQLDVSSLNELARRVWPDVYAARPTADDKPHRALPDVYNSIAQARHYARHLVSRRELNDMSWSAG